MWGGWRPHTCPPMWDPQSSPCPEGALPCPEQTLAGWWPVCGEVPILPADWVVHSTPGPSSNSLKTCQTLSLGTCP